MRLLRTKDIDTIVNACDAGREGELIFRYIIQYAQKSLRKNGGEDCHAALAAVHDAGRHP